MARNEWGEVCPNPCEPRWDKVVKQLHDFESTEPFFRKVALGNGTAFKVFGAWCSDFGRGPVIAVGVEERGFFAFSHFVHYSYLMEKMKLLNGDASNLADWINTQLDFYSPENAQGVYHPPYVEKRVVPLDLREHFAEAHPETSPPGESL